MSSALFDFVKNRLPIVDIIQEYASIKRAGNYWKAPCPFHNETAA
jgi:DNA primase